MAVQPLARSNIDALAQTVAANAQVDPDDAVRIVRMMLQAAGASQGMTTEVQVSIKTNEPKIGSFGICLVKGEVCTPIGCVCVCLVPPGKC